MAKLRHRGGQPNPCNCCKPATAPRTARSIRTGRGSALPLTHEVLAPAGDDRCPSYSPDGTKIAFRHGDDLIEPSGDEEVYVADADGTNLRRLTNNADFDSAPAWSPDGRLIAFENAPGPTLQPGVEPEEKDIYVMHADGTHVRRLTDSPGLDEGPVWSPDGTKIAFSSDRDGQQEIYVMNADGSDQRRLTKNPARDESPDWQALPFDGTGHRACGDDSLASGGASSVVAMRVPCHLARRLARRWALGADAGSPPERLKGLACSTTQRPYDLTVVDCTGHERCPRDVAFVWRDPARAPSATPAPQALAAPQQDDPADEGSAEAHDA